MSSIRACAVSLTIISAFSGAAARAEVAPAQQAASVPAQAAPAATAPKPDSGFDQAWRIPTIYKGDSTDVLNEVRIVGRFHLDNYVLDSNIADDSDLVVRRTRLGVRAKLFGKLDAHVQGDFNLEGGGPFYSRLTDAYLAWKFNDAATLTVGKQSTEFTLDGATSSNRLLAIDRSNINQNFGIATEYLPGVTLGGKSGKWTYKAGIYSGGRDNGEFGKFDAGYAIIASAGHDFGKQIGVKSAVLRVDYMYNKPDAGSDFLRRFEHTAALIAIIEQSNWGIRAEAVFADGSLGQSDGRGASIMPWVNLNKKFQLVGRLTHMTSANPNGLRFSRYENVATPGRGDRYNEAYAGVNYYIYGHNLKLQSGLTYANMRDRANDRGAYDGITWTTGLRISW